MAGQPCARGPAPDLCMRGRHIGVGLALPSLAFAAVTNGTASRPPASPSVIDEWGGGLRIANPESVLFLAVFLGAVILSEAKNPGISFPLTNTGILRSLRSLRMTSPLVCGCEAALTLQPNLLERGR